MNGCLRPTPINNLFILTGKLLDMLSELRQKRATLSLARLAMDPKHLFTIDSCSHQLHNSGNSNRGTLFVQAALELLKNIKPNTTAAFWVDHMWNMEWQKNTSRLHTFIQSPGPSPPGMTLPRPSWIRLNRLHTGVELLRSTMHKWGLVPTLNCRCSANGRSHTSLLSSVPPSKWDT